jgi:predicted transcriptional regulator of viral defense system
MDDLLLTRDLSQRGFSSSEIRRMVRRGELARIRRGAYVSDSAARCAELDPYDLRTPHRRLIDATQSQLHPRAVISHGSAAAVLALPLFAGMVEHVHLTRDRRGGGVRRPVVWVHGSPLREEDRMVSEGLVVTSMARTTVDLARTLPYDQAVAVADGGLAAGACPAELAECLEQARRWHGCGQARRVIAFADGRSESVGESYSRIRIGTAALPDPVLQFEVFDDNGILLGRSDFAWPDRRTLGEFDGRTKYGRLRRPGETVEEAAHREKLREDALRDHGWQVARWTWDDLWRPNVIADRLARAFSRAGSPLGAR